MSDSTHSTPPNADRVTRCPACSTSFRITQTQLETAKGAVRCGSCLHIFKALDHLQSPPTQSQTSNSDRLDFDQAAIDRESEDREADDDLLISDDMDPIPDEKRDPSAPSEPSTNDFLEVNSWKADTHSLFERTPEDTPPPKDQQDNTDESWAVSLLAELESEHRPEDGEAPKEGDPQHKDKPTDLSKKAEPEDYSLRATGSFSPVSDEDIEAVLGESLIDRREPTIGDSPQSLDERSSDAPTTGDENSTVPETTLDILQPDPDAEPPPSLDKLFDAEEDREEYLSNIEPAPVEMTMPPSSLHWQQRLLWGGLSLAAGLLLIIQVGWFQIDHYGRIEPYRGWYQSLCPALGCQVPPIQDRARIKASNLVVRSHPRAEEALMVDAILLNTATFEQPFPELELTFSNLRNESVAQRRFLPDEYLRGELAGRRLMPVGQPIHLSLEVVDPGPEAVNYRATIP